MGYSRTKLEEANDRVKELEQERADLEATLRQREELVRNLDNSLDRSANELQKAVSENAELKAKLEAWEKCATDEETTHVNLLRGTIALGAAKALHYAGAQGYKSPAQYAALEAKLEAAEQLANDLFRNPVVQKLQKENEQLKKAVVAISGLDSTIKTLEFCSREDGMGNITIQVARKELARLELIRLSALVKEGR